MWPKHIVWTIFIIITILDHFFLSFWLFFTYFLQFLLFLALWTIFYYFYHVWPLLTIYDHFCHFWAGGGGGIAYFSSWIDLCCHFHNLFVLISITVLLSFFAFCLLKLKSSEMFIPKIMKRFEYIVFVLFIKSQSSKHDDSIFWRYISYLAKHSRRLFYD